MSREETNSFRFQLLGPLDRIFGVILLPVQPRTPLFSNPGSPSPGSCGTLGPGTLEVLYEDPKEDQVSLLSQEEDDKRRLLSPKKMEDSHWDQKEEETWEAWKNLQEEIKDINTLIVEFSNMVVVS